MNAILGDEKRVVLRCAASARINAHTFSLPNNCEFGIRLFSCASEMILSINHIICAICLYANQVVRESITRCIVAVNIETQRPSSVRVSRFGAPINLVKMCAQFNVHHHRCAPNESPIYICQSISSTHLMRVFHSNG